MTDQPAPPAQAVYLVLTPTEATLVAETLRFGASFVAAGGAPEEGTVRADEKLTAIAALLDVLVTKCGGPDGT